MNEELLKEEAEYVDSTSEELMGQLAVNEEIKRIKIQDSPKSKVPKDVKDSELYNELTSTAHIIGSCIQILLGYGVDYNNAVAIGNNLNQNKVELEKTRVQSVLVSNQTV